MRKKSAISSAVVAATAVLSAGAALGFSSRSRAAVLDSGATRVGAISVPGPEKLAAVSGWGRLAGRLGLVALALASTHCNPDEPLWPVSAITGMVTPADPPLACPLQIPPDKAASRRAACEFGVGARASQTLGIGRDVSAQIPIRHVVVLMKENRSFDHLFGKLHDQGAPGVEPVPSSFENPDASGMRVPPTHASTTCLQLDPDHGWDAMHHAVDGGKMDGFVSTAAASTGTNGHAAMSYYDASDLPAYYFFASTFAVDDRHFASVRSGTDPNRDFLLLGTSAGERDTGTQTPDPSTPSIFSRLIDAGFTWGVYSDGTPLSGTLQWDHDDPGTHGLGDFVKALDAGTLPNVAFVDGRDYVDDDHPTADLQRGEAWLSDIYAHATKSPEWPRMAMIWTYDEGGGFADHVPPPDACIAHPDTTDPAQIVQPGSSDTAFFELGPRVPFVVISPYARPHYVSHVVQEHTAITRFIETVFDLPALTARDANSSALLDLFDFSCDPTLLVPPPAPPPGTGGCGRG